MISLRRVPMPDQDTDPVGEDGAGFQCFFKALKFNHLQRRHANE
jgi:hypothetical protein